MKTKRNPESVGFESEFWLGKKSGEWPIFTFSSESKAKIWASASDGEFRQRYIIGPVRINLAEFELRQAVKTQEVVWKE